MQRRRSCALFLFAVLPGCQALIGDYSADLDESAPLDTTPLCATERDTFVLDLDLESDTAFDALEPYYEAANPELAAHFSTIAGKFRNGEEHAGVTYMWGAAGVGKSFVTRNLLDAFDDSERCDVELSDLFNGNVDDRGFEVEPRADLATLDGNHVFNTLLTISDPAKFKLETFLDAMGCFDDGELRPLVIVDGIDEIHDNSSRLILERIDDFVIERSKNLGGFVHFLVSGRPEGFASWLNASERTEENSNVVRQFDLEPPHYQTAGDLAYRVTGYLEFAVGDVEPAFLAAYIDSFTQAVVDYPFLTYTIGNLATGNFVIEQTAPDLELSERSLKNNLLDDLLVRNADTHGRPGADSDLEGPYRRALEDIAAKYTHVDTMGRFSVSLDDTVTAYDEEGESLGRLRVRSVLNRSGVALLTDPATATTRYRFDPFWLHAHLIERRNQRLFEGAKYRACN